MSRCGPGGHRTRHAVVTIDGPAGAGKSAVARRLAERLGYAYVNSGSIYRAVAWRASSAAAADGVLAGTRIEFRGPPGDQRVLVDGTDVTHTLGAPGVSDLASTISQQAQVRAFADAVQREEATHGPVVVEGRDAGTVVFPEADCKFYLDASLEARAQRRLADRQGRGEAAELSVVREALAARDLADRTRSLAPLSRAPDATYIDSSDMTMDEVVEVMAKAVERACSTRS